SSLPLGLRHRTCHLVKVAGFRVFSSPLGAAPSLCPDPLAPGTRIPGTIMHALGVRNRDRLLRPNPGTSVGWQARGLYRRRDVDAGWKRRRIGWVRSPLGE